MIFGVILRILGGLVGGYCADKWGRKALILITEAVVMLSYFSFLLFTQGFFAYSLALPVVAYLLINISLGAYEPAIEGMILDIVPLESRKTVYGFFYWLYNLSVAFGGIIGGFFFKEFLPYLLSFAAGGYTIILLITFFFVDETNPVKPSKSNESINARSRFRDIVNNYIEVVQDKIFVLFVLASLLIISIEFHLNNYIGVRLENEIQNQKFLGFSFDGIQLLGFLKTENTLIIVMTGLFLNHLLTKTNDKNTLFTGFFFYIAGFTILSYSNSAGLLFAAMLMATVGEALFIPIRQSYMAQLIPMDKRSSYIAVHGSIKSLSLFIASMVLIIGQVASKEMISLLILLTGVVGVILFYYVVTKINKKNVMVSSSRHEEV